MSSSLRLQCTLKYTHDPIIPMSSTILKRKVSRSAATALEIQIEEIGPNVKQPDLPPEGIEK
jgi:hypothetical protein